MQKQVVYVTSFPKSGSTWLTRLLADILDSPSGGCMPSEDANEIATEGLDRPGPYVVRKGHFVLEDGGLKPVVPRPHRLAWEQLTDEKIIFLVRDPRDICISGAYHWRVTPAEFLDRMIKGDVAKCGRWDEYVSEWIHFNHDICTVIKYEMLLMCPIIELSILRERLSLSFPTTEQVEVSLQRQSFTARAAGKDEKELRRNNMRKGIVGDWRNHFTPEMSDKIWNEFGWVMEGLGYDQ